MEDAIIMYENGHPIGGEGHPTDASDITFDNSNTDLVSENVEGAIKEVNTKKAEKWTLLWENLSPTASFAAQNITLSSGDYDLLVIIIKDYKGGDNMLPTVIIPKGTNAQAQSAGYSGGTMIAYRMFNYVSNTSYTVTDAYRNGSANNEIVIPIAIYGIKVD